MPEEFTLGIDAETGECLPSLPSEIEELQRRMKDPSLTPAQRREYEWWINRYGIDDPDRAPAQDVDPLDLGSSGWGIVYAPDVGPDVRNALAPLCERRKQLAGSVQEYYYQEYVLAGAPSKSRFLSQHSVAPGPADPETMPYYLLVVGDPRTIPFRFQYELDMQYAVGRLHFDTAEEYALYAKSVVEAETRPTKRSPDVTFFGVHNGDDRATERTTLELVEPLAEKLAKDRPSWNYRRLVDDQADKVHLGRLLGGDLTPALLFTASHGVRFSADHPGQREGQGALLCRDWPGRNAWEGALTPEQYFTGADVAAEADLTGLIAIHFACYSAGSPEFDSFELSEFGFSPRIACKPFVSRLSQRLLAHPKGGALAVVGHVDRAWTMSFSWSDTAQIQLFESTLKRLLDGHPVGSAMEYINQRYAELAVEMTELWADREQQRTLSRDHFVRTWKANNDARNFIVVGDPAVRLNVDFPTPRSSEQEA